MEKRIGIVAPHRYSNYGTLLQAYALSKVISDSGYDCEYISYSVAYKHSIFERIWNKIKRICGVAPQSMQKSNGIDDLSFWRSEDFKPLVHASNQFYHQYIPHSECVYNPKTIWKANGKYSKFIAGSDQTWSMEHYSDEKGFNFLSFARRWKRKYAYAPSLGTTHLTEEHKRVLAKYLPSFRAISCRERSNSEELTRMLKREVTYVVDPTLLIGKKEWLRLANKVESLPNKYILAYILGEKACISEFAEQIGKEKGIPVYYVLTRPKYLAMPHCLTDMTPQQWIYAIAHSECVVTDSFHGSLFSMNLEKDFYTFYKREHVKNDLNDNDRIMDLLSTYNLAERIMNDTWKEEGKFTYSSIDYAQVTPIVQDKVKASQEYLKRILND